MLHALGQCYMIQLSVIYGKSVLKVSYMIRVHVILRGQCCVIGISVI